MQPVGSAGCFSLAKPPAKPTSRNDADVKFKSLGWIEIKRYIVAFAEKIQGNAQSPTHRRGNHREDPGQCAFSNSSPWKSQKRPMATRILQLIATEIAEKTENQRAVAATTTRPRKSRSIHASNPSAPAETGLVPIAASASVVAALSRVPSWPQPCARRCILLSWLLPLPDFPPTAKPPKRPARGGAPKFLSIARNPFVSARHWQRVGRRLRWPRKNERAIETSRASAPSWLLPPLPCLPL